MTGTNGSNRAVLYARVSSKDQEREGFSIPAQLKLLRQYAHEQHLTIVREFVDVETAKQSGRGGFGEMIAALRADTSCRTILVEKTDRLYRNIKDWMTVDDLDVTIHFVKENAIVSRDSRSSDKFLHGIKVLMAKNYVDNLSEEVKKGTARVPRRNAGRAGDQLHRQHPDRAGDLRRRRSPSQTVRPGAGRQDAGGDL